LVSHLAVLCKKLGAIAMWLTEVEEAVLHWSGKSVKHAQFSTWGVLSAIIMHGN